MIGLCLLQPDLTVAGTPLGYRQRVLREAHAMIHEPEKLGYLRSGTRLKSPSQPGASTRETRVYFELPVHITKEASKQAYYTIRLLVDHDRTLAAYRSYAYFRWVDDWLDQPTSERTERLDFITRQPYFGVGLNPSSVLSLYAGFFARLATSRDIVWGQSSSFRCGRDSLHAAKCLGAW